MSTYIEDRKTVKTYIDIDIFDKHVDDIINEFKKIKHSVRKNDIIDIRLESEWEDYEQLTPYVVIKRWETEQEYDVRIQRQRMTPILKQEQLAKARQAKINRLETKKADLSKQIAKLRELENTHAQ